ENIPGASTTTLYSAGDTFYFRPPASALGTPITVTFRAYDLAGNFADQVVTFTVDGFAAWFPEGFTGENIDEFLALINPHGLDVNYRVNVWYENFTHTTLAGEGAIAANSRGGVVVSTKDNWNAGPVFP